LSDSLTSFAISPFSHGLKATAHYRAGPSSLICCYNIALTPFGIWVRLKRKDSLECVSNSQKKDLWEAHPLPASILQNINQQCVALEVLKIDLSKDTLAGCGRFPRTLRVLKIQLLNLTSFRSATKRCPLLSSLDIIRYTT